jgi:hypothetical protein
MATCYTRASAHTSVHSRIAYTFKINEGPHRYDARNWLQPGVAAKTRSSCHHKH